MMVFKLGCKIWSQLNSQISKNSRWRPNTGKAKFQTLILLNLSILGRSRSI